MLKSSSPRITQKGGLNFISEDEGDINKTVIAAEDTLGLSSGSEYESEESICFTCKKVQMIL